MALRLPNAYCDELANCAIEFIVEYPCFDNPLLLKTVAPLPADDCVVDCEADDDKLPAFWNLPNLELANELGGGTAFIEKLFEFPLEFDAEFFGGPLPKPLR